MSSRHRRTTMNFRMVGLPAKLFSHLFTQSATELAWQGAVRQIADARNPGRPSLRDGQQGDDHEYHTVEPPPCRPRFASYLRKETQPDNGVNIIPEHLRRRVLAVRAFDSKAMMVGFELAEGRDLEAAIERQLATPCAEYLQIHFAAAGCYAARVERN